MLVNRLMRVLVYAFVRRGKLFYKHLNLVVLW